jgi:hypothetical protein
VDTQTSKREYADLRAKALAICDKAVAEARQLSEAEQAKLSGLVEQAKGKYAEVERARLPWARA